MKMASELRGLSFAFRWTGEAARKVNAVKSAPLPPPPPWAADEASPLESPRRRDEEEGSAEADSSPESAAKLARAATAAPELSRRRRAATKPSGVTSPLRGRGGRRWTAGGGSISPLFESSIREARVSPSPDSLDRSIGRFGGG